MGLEGGVKRGVGKGKGCGLSCFGWIRCGSYYWFIIFFNKTKNNNQYTELMGFGSEDCVGKWFWIWAGFVGK